MTKKMWKHIIPGAISVCIVASLVLAAVLANGSSTRERSGVYTTEQNTGDMNLVPYNNPSRMIDLDGDGIVDLIDDSSSWEEYLGPNQNLKDVRYTSDGVWGDDNHDGILDENDAIGPSDLNEDGTWDGDDDPVHGWIMWVKGTENYDQGRIYNFNANETQVLQVYEYTVEGGKKIPDMESGKALDVYGRPCAQFADWDRDGDYDLICGSFRGDITYFENIGEKTNPIFAVGREIPVVDEKGNKTGVLTSDMPAMTLTQFDWNGDNYMDLFVSEEDGRVALAQHTGELDENDTPIMKERAYFQAPADQLHMGNINTIRSVDWDEDGDEDIISGDAAGYLVFIENLTIQVKDGVKYTFDGKLVSELSKKELTARLSDPSWNKPVNLRNKSDNSIYRVIAGVSGSIQGDTEVLYGYTNISVADWDGDGTLDIMSNNVHGEIWWHKGIPGDTLHIEDPRPVEAEWQNKAQKPDWIWWEPEGKQIITQWRSTPEMVDLPLRDLDGDGVADGDGLMDLVALDVDGFLCLYERYEDTDGTLKLKEPERIFRTTANGDLRFAVDHNIVYPGGSGRTKFQMVDYDMDGDLDILRGYEENVIFYENVATTSGQYIMQCDNQSLGDRNIADHAMPPTVCDWDCNGVPDILIGANDGNVYYLKNTLIANPDDHLMAQWDFEGEGNEVFEDKSWRRGNIKDTLYVVSSAAEVKAGKAEHTANASNYVTVENGVAKFKSGKGIASALMALNSDDLNPEHEMTIFFRAKFGEGTKAATALFDKGLHSRSYSLQLWRNTSANPITKFKAEIWAGGARVVDSNITEASNVNNE